MTEHVNGKMPDQADPPAPIAEEPPPQGRKPTWDELLQFQVSTPMQVTLNGLLQCLSNVPADRVLLAMATTFGRQLSFATHQGDLAPQLTARRLMREAFEKGLNSMAIKPTPGPLPGTMTARPRA